MVLPLQLTEDKRYLLKLVVSPDGNIVTAKPNSKKRKLQTPREKNMAACDAKILKTLSKPSSIETIAKAQDFETPESVLLPILPVQTDSPPTFQDEETEKGSSLRPNLLSEKLGIPSSTNHTSHDILNIAATKPGSASTPLTPALIKKRHLMNVDVFGLDKQYEEATDEGERSDRSFGDTPDHQAYLATFDETMRQVLTKHNRTIERKLEKVLEILQSLQDASANSKKNVVPRATINDANEDDTSASNEEIQFPDDEIRRSSSHQQENQNAGSRSKSSEVCNLFMAIRI